MALATSFEVMTSYFSHIWLHQPQKKHFPVLYTLVRRCSTTHSSTHESICKASRGTRTQLNLHAVLEDLTSSNPEYKQWAEEQRKKKTTDRETRKISRALNAIINGLAGTQEDVADKFARVQSELASRTGAARTEVVVQLARKVVNQCAEMVAKSPQYAWPLAAFVSQVATIAPELPDVLLAVIQVLLPLPVLMLCCLSLHSCLLFVVLQHRPPAPMLLCRSRRSLLHARPSL
jgi:hypothetical protein